jgi:hypothetical protein
MPQPSSRPRRASRLTRSGALVPVLVVALAAVMMMPAAAQGGGQGTRSGNDVRPMVLGVSMQPDRSQAVYDGFVQQVGRAPAIWSFWSDWGNLDAAGCVGGPTSLPPDPALIAHLHERGTVPLFIWQPVDSKQLDSPRYAYDEIAKGTFDCYLRSFAQSVGSIPGPVLIRFAHEFDGYWFPWGIGRFTNTPETFIAAWRHIRDIFTEVAPNARFIWSPLGGSSPKKMNALWPGDQYVDYIGMTAFNWAAFHTDPKGRPVDWKSLPRIVDSRLRGFRDHPDKPIIITELGSHFEGGDKAAWISDGYDALAQRYPQIVGAIYFNVDMNTVNDPGHVENWILTMPQDGSALEAYQRLLDQRRFKGSIPGAAPATVPDPAESPAGSLAPSPSPG